MKAAVLHEFGQPLLLEEVPTPTPEPGEVLIEIEACGVCHSDLHIIDGDQAGYKAGTKPLLIPGHEVVGRIVERGAAVDGLDIGDRVGAAWMHWSCGECVPCSEGMENLCRRTVVTGLMVDGGYAQFMRAKASHVLPIPGTLEPAEAAPLFCAGVTVYRALKNAGATSGRRVAVFGVGGLGHLAIQVARAFGAEVLAFDINESKLETARSLGAAQVINAGDSEAVKAVRRSGGVHVAVVTSAAKAAYDSAFRCLRPGGVLSVVGLPAEPLTFPALAIVSGESRIMGSAIGTREDLKATLDLAAEGKIRCRVETVPLSRVNEALDRMRRGEIDGRIVLTKEEA